MNELVSAAATKTNFTSFDWLIVVAYLLVSLAIGLVVKRFATNMTAYIAAGRSVGVWLGVASMTGTELGLVTICFTLIVFVVVSLLFPDAPKREQTEATEGAA